MKRTGWDACGAYKKQRVSIRRPLWAVLLLLAAGFAQTLMAAQSLPFTLSAPFLTLQPLSLANTDRQWLNQRKTLRVGVPIADYEPIDITSDRNRYQGISADYLGLLGARLALPVQVVGFARRERAVAALLSGEIDVLTSASGFERGIAGLDFTRQYIPDRSVVVGHGKDFGLTPSLKGKRIVLLDGYADADVLGRVYPESEIILAPNLYSAVEALSHGDADAFIGNEIILRSYNALRPYLNLQIPFDSALPSSGFAFAVRAGDEPLRRLMDQALESIDESAAREILGRWTLGLGADVARQRVKFNSAEQLWARKHPQVIVASGQYPPYVYRDDHGRWVGLNVDMLARISRMTGLQFVHKEMPTTQATLEALSSGQADMNTSLAENAERMTILDFTYSFGGNNWVFLVHKDASPDISLDQLAGKTLALPASHALEATIRSHHPGIRLRLTSTYDEARRLVEEGRADATIQNEAGAWMYPPGSMKVARGVEGEWSPDRFSVNKREPELLSILNKALEEFPVAEMRAIRMKWLGATMVQPSLWQQVPDALIWAVAVSGLLMLVSLVCNRRLKQQLRAREQ